MVCIHNGILAIKGNIFESILISWMNLAPIVKSEVSQKEKNKYCILMHIYIYMESRQMVLMKLYAGQKAMAPHSSTLAWKIPWVEEPGRLQSMGSLRVGQD